MNTTYDIGHGRIDYLEHIAELVGRCPHMLFAFIADHIGSKMCPKHQFCLYLPRSRPFPTIEDIEQALVVFFDEFVFCRKCNSPANMDLKLGWDSDNLKAICRICGAMYTAPPYVCEFANMKPLRPKTGDQQEGKGDRRAAEASDKGGR